MWADVLTKPLQCMLFLAKGQTDRQTDRQADRVNCCIQTVNSYSQKW